MAHKTEIGQHFPAEAYAYVGDPTNPDTWALRMWESVGQKMTGAQVARAVAALSATRAGRGLKIPDASLPTVKEKLRTSFASTHTEMPVPTVLKTFSSAVGDMKKFAMTTGLPPLVQTDDGKYAVLGMKIFKTGTFRDSNGQQMTVDTAYLNGAVQNFYALKESGVLPDVPWRLDHSRSVESVVGYFENAYTDPTGEFLLCDFAFTDDGAAQKYAQGKYRARSIEIGPHTLNSEETYDPVIMGCAFVDLPAVEGLNNYASAGSHVFPFQEIEQMPTFMLNGVPVSDEKAVQDHIAKLEAQKPPVHEFTVGGATGTKVSDFAKVQEQLDRIPGFEAFQGETKIAARTAAVDAAVTANKLAAPQAKGIKEFVVTLSDDQFAAWKKTTDDAPAIPAFGAYMGGGNGDDRDPNAATGAPNAVEDAKAQVRMHKLAGMSDAALKETTSFKMLAAQGITVSF